MSRGIRIEYYALLREERGLREEEFQTDAVTAGELYDQLKELHGFSLMPDGLKVVVNEEFSAWDHPLAEGDTIVFIPPVAGG